MGDNPDGGPKRLPPECPNCGEKARYRMDMMIISGCDECGYCGPFKDTNRGVQIAQIFSLMEKIVAVHDAESGDVKVRPGEDIVTVEIDFEVLEDE